MNQNLKINFSAVVVCYNEAHLLPQCLASIDFCQEVIIVDLGSTDDSVRVAREWGARVLSHERLPNPNVPRQYGIAQATNEWVLTIDLDEIFPKDEIKKVEAVILENPDWDALRIPIQYYFKGKELNCTIWGRPGMTRWAILHRDRAQGTPYAHREFKSDQKIYHFSWSEMKPIKHYWRNSYWEVIEKMLPYLKVEGQAQYAYGKRFSWSAMLKHTAAALKTDLIDYRGLYGGFTGLFLSFVRAWYVFMTWFSLRQYEHQLLLVDQKAIANE